MPVNQNIAVAHCQWRVFIRYQKELADHCQKVGLGAACRLPYPENQSFNWDNNMAQPTAACETN